MAMRNEALKKRQHNMYNEVLIHGVPYAFKVRELFEGKLSMVLPADFEEMDRELAKTKYMSPNGPQMVLCNHTGDISFALNMEQIPLQAEDVAKRVDEMRIAIKRFSPACVFHEQKVGNRNDNEPVGYFAFKSYALDMDIYNTMFATSIEGRLFFGSFSCPDLQGDEWKDLVNQMLQSITDLTKNRDTETEGKISATLDR